ncbi:MAG: DNA polymerase III subunit delta' [Lachnospiraceae bacterium]|nr:DNA polymerase III subunit delta' [Lachnospiraceae bacterium]
MGGFQNIIGHSDVISFLKNSIETDRVSHAYIINGPEGAGKLRIAKAFAATLQCEKGGTDACLECHSCKQSLSENHPDIIKLVREKLSSIGVNEIREQINNSVAIKPYNSRYKIYIIEDAHLMTTQAQNALLKTIEEPAEYAIFLLLVSNRDALLTTIQSRCVTLNLRPVNSRLIREYLLRTFEMTEYEATVCAAFAQGNVGKAEKLAGSDKFNKIKDEAISLIKCIPSMEIYEIIETIRHITEFKVDINDYLDILMIWYRDILLFKATKNVSEIVFQDEINDIKKAASSSTYPGIETIIQALEKAKVRLKANVNFELTMELLLLTIKEN